MKRFFITLFGIMPLVAIVLAVLQIVLTNQLVGSGKTIHIVDAQVDMLRRDNEVLEQRVASASSLVTIAVKAKDMGFGEPAKTQYVTIGSSQLPVAFNNPR